MIIKKWVIRSLRLREELEHTSSDRFHICRYRKKSTSLQLRAKDSDKHSMKGMNLIFNSAYTIYTLRVMMAILHVIITVIASMGIHCMKNNTSSIAGSFSQ